MPRVKRRGEQEDKNNAGNRGVVLTRERERDSCVWGIQPVQREERRGERFERGMNRDRVSE
jgi:hypothetical protein